MSFAPESGAASAPETPLFRDLPLPEPILRALEERDYTTPTPIQAQIIPHVVAGRDVIGQAQTGTGKTAAFALPLLARIDVQRRTPQVLVLAPTRELASQVAEACIAYGKHLKGLTIAAVYGGAGYGDQLRDLRRGAQIVVGTPGRVMDHIAKGSLDVSALDCLVLDEADEMLRMGFIDDVEWVLARTPPQRQVSLFSATMPPAIRKIADRYLVDPVVITIAATTRTADTVRQRYWFVRGMAKCEALARIIEGIDTDGVMVFVRTKLATVDIAESLQARGIAATALNGDMAQAQRERAVEQLKSGELDVVVATDVAARGLDVQRISHVINYDMPGDNESYVHRIGRTGRAGRSGEAILFVHPREKRGLRDIERHTRQPIEEMDLPDAAAINQVRVQRFAQRIKDAAEGDLSDYEAMITRILDEEDLDPVRLAAAMARLLQGDRPLFVSDQPQRRERREMDRNDGPQGARGSNDQGAYYRLEVGHRHGTKPGMIVGAIANELNLPGHAIGAIEIHDVHTTVALPESLTKADQQTLRRIRVVGRQLEASLLDHVPPPAKRFGRGSGGPPRGGRKGGPPKKQFDRGRPRESHRRG